MDAVPRTQFRYPIGIQTFSEVRREGYVYVDKTRYVYELAHTSGKYFFLSRPRRFGKSLLVSTMQSYFEGRRELFSGLEIEGLETQWESYPVLRLDLSTIKTTDVGELRSALEYVLSKQEVVLGRDPDAGTLGSRLYGLIKRAHDQSGQQVVVLVDEYDAPLLNVTHDDGKLQEFREVMRGFYAPLKACDEHLRFVFLTGITKFSQLSIFSELNNLRNISMNPHYAAICGISEQELLEEMGACLDEFASKLGVGHDAALAQLKEHYDGYHFTADSPDIYNPFSLISALANGRIESYWFGSGTPTFLVSLLQQRQWDIASVDGCTARETSFDAPAERLDTPLPMLYQAGYLTIKGYDPRRRAYTLGVPNREVRHGLSESLVQYAAPGALESHYGFLDRFADCLLAGSMEDALKAMQSYLAGIPYHLGSRDERGFETTFYLIFDLLGIQIETEYKTATGRVDAVVRTNDAVYVMEFKYDKTAAEALRQIDEKGYALPFEADGRIVVKAGINYSSEQRTISDWLIE